MASSGEEAATPMACVPSGQPAALVAARSRRVSMNTGPWCTEFRTFSRAQHDIACISAAVLRRGRMREQHHTAGPAGRLWTRLAAERTSGQLKGTGMDLTGQTFLVDGGLGLAI